MADVMKVLQDLEYRAAGVNPETQKMNEGFFVSFRPIGLPIPEEDYKNPWTPSGSNLKEHLDEKRKDNQSVFASEPKDPATIQAISASKQLDDAQWLSANVGADMESFVHTFQLTDKKLAMNSQYQVAPGDGNINDAWFAIINGANSIPPELELNGDIKKAVEKSKSIMQTPEGDSTPHFDKYLQYRDEYQEAVQNRDRQYGNAFSDPMKLQMWPIQGKTYQDDVNFAWDKWQALGFKQEIEEAMAVLSSQGIDPAILLIARAKKKYENSLVDATKNGTIPYTTISPSKWYSPNHNGWNTYSQNDFHSEVHVDTKVSKTAGGGGFNLGFYRAEGSGSYESDKTSINISTDGLAITFSYAMVDINRPWLDTTLLTLDNWFLVGDYPASCISNGTFNQQFNINDPKLTIMLPSIITGLVLISDLTIQWNHTQQDIDTLKTAASGGGSVGIGPFHISGSHSEEHSKYDNVFDNHSQGLKIEGVQLIGYVSTIMPGSPKKNGKDYLQKKQDKPAEPATTDTKPTEPTPANPAPNPTPNTNPEPAPTT
jgi:hypothetical protein